MAYHGDWGGGGGGFLMSSGTSHCFLDGKVLLLHKKIKLILQTTIAFFL